MSVQTPNPPDRRPLLRRLLPSPLERQRSRLALPPHPALDPARDPVMAALAHRAYPLAPGPWRLSQQWNDLLFAHWPVDPRRVAATLPPGLELDTFQGAAWLGVVPFWMDRVRFRLAGRTAVGAPTAGRFAELNLRTYVRSARTGRPGVFFYALDCASLLAVLGARTVFHLPYFYARMGRRREGAAIRYRSRRRFARRTVGFNASYAPAPGMVEQGPGTLAEFLTARYCLYTPHAGRMLRGEIHHGPWPLEPATATITRNDLPAAHGFSLPDAAPVLYFSRSLDVRLWPLVEDR